MERGTRGLLGLRQSLLCNLIIVTTFISYDAAAHVRFARWGVFLLEVL
jgi:hypothetical protein